MSDLLCDGLKVADFSWVGVGPITMKYLADWGATVVHIETHTKPCVLRLSSPFKDNLPGIDRSQFHADYNSSKLGVSINFFHPKGRELARKFIQWADIVAESYTPGTMKRWGLDYESVREARPEIVYFSTCMYGQYGPHAQNPGFGQFAASLAGAYDLSGWPDRPPSPPYGAYTDVINPRIACATLIGALDHAKRTGQGQRIDQSQLEAALHFFAPQLMDYWANGVVAPRNGNRLPYAAPHGAYRCRGEDRWVAITVFDDAEWQALREAMGSPVWAQDARFATLTGRKEHEDDLDRLMEDWTKDYTAEQVMTLLQARGVAAQVVEAISDLYVDPQLTHRGHFRRLQHAVMGEVAYDGPCFRVSGAKDRQFAAPALGQHNFEVLTEILGLPDDEVADLMAEGALTTPEDFPIADWR